MWSASTVRSPNRIWNELRTKRAQRTQRRMFNVRVYSFPLLVIPGAIGFFPLEQQGLVLTPCAGDEGELSRCHESRGLTGKLGLAG